MASRIKVPALRWKSAWLRIKITVVAVVIGFLVSVIAISVANRWIAEGIEQQFEEMALIYGQDIVRDVEKAIAPVPETFADILSKHEHPRTLENIRVFCDDGHEAFKEHGEEAPQIVRDVLQRGTPMHVHSASDGKRTLTWVLPLRNRQECMRCHEESKKVLGAVMLALPSEDMADAIRQQQKRYHVLFILISVLVGIVAIAAFNRIILRPLLRIKQGTEAIARGDYSYRIPNETHDELGSLTEDFNRMAEQLRQAFDERSRRLKDVWALSETPNVLSSLPPAGDIHGAVCDISIRKFGLDMAWLGLDGESKDGVASSAYCSLEQAPAGSTPPAPPDPGKWREAWGKAVAMKTPQVYQDLAEGGGCGVEGGGPGGQMYRSCIILPLLTYENRVLGVLHLFSRQPNFFSDESVKLLSVFANQAANALWNRRLIQDLQAKNLELARQFDIVSQAHHEWQLTFDSITDMIALVDNDYRVLRVNKAFADFQGMTYKELLGKKCHELLHKDVVPLASCPHEMSVKSGRSSFGEVVDPVSGKVLFVSTFPYSSQDGAPIGTINVIRDVTEEKEREVKLIMTERLSALGQMASGIAHEINNPLATIAGCAEGLLGRLKKGRFDEQLFERYLNLINEEVVRCKGITTTMLSFVRRASYEKKELDLSRMLDKVLDLVGLQGRLRDVEVVKRYDERKPVALMNEGELLQVLLAIVSNALDAMREKGALTLETGVEDGRPFVRITDTGGGIPATVLPKIFMPFFTTKTEAGGTGLGLPIASKIVSDNNGHITVETSEGKGTIFTISFAS